MNSEENIDGTVTYEDVLVKDVYGAENPSRVKVISRTFKQRFLRSAKRSGKLYLIVLCAIPVAIFVHALFALALLTILVATGLFFWGLGDTVTFEYVEGECPKCKVVKRFKSLGNGRLNYPLSLNCDQCGGTYTAIRNH